MPEPAYTYAAELIRVIDGDTFELRIDLGFYTWHQVTVRLFGVNCPETRGASRDAGAAATEATKLWFATHTGLVVRTRKDPRKRTDSFRRYLCEVWGHGGMCMLNIFGWRDTDPRVMREQPDPIGPGNDAALRLYGQRARLVVGCWGNHGTHLGRAAAIPGVIGRPIHCLAVTSTGQPGHPLYLRSSLVPQLWTPPIQEADAKTA